MELFLGRLGRDPELKYTPNRVPVCHLSVAINKGEDEKPEWKKVIVWNKQAELCSLYLKKGKEVFVKGETEKKEFTTKEGERKEYFEVNAKVIGFTNI